LYADACGASLQPFLVKHPSGGFIRACVGSSLPCNHFSGLPTLSMQGCLLVGRTCRLMPKIQAVVTLLGGHLSRGASPEVSRGASPEGGFLSGGLLIGESPSGGVVFSSPPSLPFTPDKFQGGYTSLGFTCAYSRTGGVKEVVLLVLESSQPEDFPIYFWGRIPVRFLQVKCHHHETAGRWGLIR